MNFLTLLIALLIVPNLAHATGIEVAIATLLGGSAAAATAASFITKWLIGTALTLLGQAFADKPEQQSRGIRTSVTLSGGTNPQSFGFGRYATGGALVCPPLSHQHGSTPNDLLTYVIDLGDLPGATLEKLFVNGEDASDSEFGGGLFGYINDPADADFIAMYGSPVPRFEKHLWIKYYDGTQTEADPMLVEKYGDHPDYPWSANMIGRNKPYAIITAKYDPDFWTGGLPAFRFEMMGLPLYDVRKDTTAGGLGSHRWDDPATWEQTENLAVQVYNIMRGIRLPSGEVWGGQESADLPLAVWAAAMNECDVAIPLESGGTEPQYRGGLEIMVDDEPRQVIDKLLLGCAGQVADVGGTWHIRVGPVGLPVYFMTDDDIVVTKAQELDPFPGLESTFNAVSIKHPSPDAAWEYTDAPTRYRPDLEDLDRGRRLVADLTVDVVPYPTQVQRLASSYSEDHRRFLGHTLPLPPDAIGLNVLESIQWDSDRNQYDGKIFELTGSEKHPLSLQSVVALRERDPSDWNWQPSDYIPAVPAPTRRTPSDPFVLPGFSVQPELVPGDAGSGSRPGIRINYTNVGVASIAWRIRVKASEQTVGEGIVPNLADGSNILPFNAQPATTYQVQALVQVRGQAEWTDWLDVTTDDVRPGLNDLDQGVSDAISNAAGSAAADVAAAQAERIAAEAAALEADADRVAAEGHEIASNAHKLAAEAGAVSAASSASQAADSRDAAKLILDQTYVPDFRNDAEYWVAYFTQSKADLESAPSGLASYADVTVEAVAGIGEVLQGNGAYRVVSERNLRPFIDGQKVRLEIKTRLTQDPLPASGAHKHYAWLTGVSENGGYSGYWGIRTWSGLTVADGWVTRTYEFDPTAVRAEAPSAFQNATEWRLMVGLNGYDVDVGGAIQQIAYINLYDITSEDASKGHAEAAATSESVATAKETEAGQHALAAQDARTGAETAEGQAEVHKNAAAESETNAGNSASLAAASESVTASLKDDAENAAKRAELLNLDSTFDLGFSGITGSSTGDPATRPDYGGSNSTLIASDDSEVGGNTIVAVGDVSIRSKHVIPVEIDRKYRMRVRVRRALADSGDPRLYLGFYNLRSDYTATATSTTYYVNNWRLAKIPVSSEYVELVSDVFTGSYNQGANRHKSFRDDTAYVRLLAFLNYGSGSDPDHVMHISGWWWEDVTESEAAKTHANASASSAAVAETHKNDAETHALAAQSERTAAETANAGAQIEVQNATRAKEAALSGATGNILADNAFVDPDLWQMHSTGSSYALIGDVINQTLSDGSKGFKIVTTQGVTKHCWFYTTNSIPLDHSRTVRVTFRYRSTSNAAHYINVRKTGTSTNGYWGITGQIINDGQWHDFSYDINLSTLPSWAEGTQIELGFGFRHGSNTAGEMEVKNPRIEDVTNLLAAEAEATAAQTARIGAETAEAGAQVHETNAANSETSAAGSAASALSSKTVSAKLISKGICADPVFSEWYSDTNLVHFIESAGDGSTLTRNSTDAKYENCVEMVTADPPINAKPYLRFNALGTNGHFKPATAKRVLVTIEVELVSGSWGGARLQAQWLGSPSGTAYHYFTSEGVPEDHGVIQKIEVMFERPDGYIEGGSDYFRSYFYATTNSSSNGGYQTNHIRIHSFDVQPVYEGSYSDIIQSAVAGVGDMQASMLGLRVGAGGAEGGLEIVAADDPVNGPKVVATFTGDELIADGTLKAKNIEAGGITRDGSATYEWITMYGNGATWSDWCEFTLTDMPLASRLHGNLNFDIFDFRMSIGGQGLGDQAEIRVLMNGAVVYYLDEGDPRWFNLSENCSGLHSRQFVVNNVPTGDVTFKLQFRGDLALHFTYALMSGLAIFR